MWAGCPVFKAIRRSRTLPPDVVGGAVCPNVWERQDRIPAPKGNAVNDDRNEIRSLSMITDPHELARAVNQVVSEVAAAPAPFSLPCPAAKGGRTWERDASPGQACLAEDLSHRTSELVGVVLAHLFENP